MSGRASAPASPLLGHASPPSSPSQSQSSSSRRSLYGSANGPDAEPEEVAVWVAGAAAATTTSASSARNVALGVSVAAQRQPVLDALAREEQDARDAQRHRTISGHNSVQSATSEHATPFGNSSLAEPSRSGADASGKSWDEKHSLAEPLAPQSRRASSHSRNPFGSGDEVSDDDERGAYVPPGAGAPSAASTESVHRRLRSPSFSAYTFSPPTTVASAADRALADSRSLNGSHSYPVVVSAQNADIESAYVSATDLERSLLTVASSSSAEAHAPGPLLLDYKKSNSSIRKDFTTIDWFFSRHTMHRLRRLLHSDNERNGWRGKLKNMALAGQGSEFTGCACGGPSIASSCNAAVDMQPVWVLLVLPSLTLCLLCFFALARAAELASCDLFFFASTNSWVVLFLVGVCTAFSAAMIHSVSAWLSDVKDGYCSGHNYFLTRRLCCMDEQVPGHTCQAWSKWSAGVAEDGSAAGTLFDFALYTVLASTFGFLGSWVCVVYARQAAGSGIAELKIILGGFIVKKFLGVRTLFFKAIGLTLAVASGLSLGKEGPMVHIAVAWGNILARPFLKYATNEVKKVEVLSAAVASGVTAAFGSPLGGVLFSLEVVSSYFPPKTMWRSFFCSIVTALVLLWLDPMQSGQLVEFSMTINQWQWFELAPFVLLGVLGGAMGALFIRFNVAATQFRRGNRWLRARPTLDVLILTFVTACLSFPNMFMRGNSGSLLAQLFADCNVSSVSSDDDYNQGSDSVMSALCQNDNDPWGYIGLLVIAFIVRFLLTTVTYGASIPSGVFMPTLVTGALLGRVVGWLMWMWHRSVGDVGVFAICAGKSQCISPALYAVIGAASVLGGITRMTVSLAVILFEVTGAGGAETIVPIMVAVVCSKWSGDAFGAAGLYGRLIELNGLPHIDTHSEVDLPNPAAEMMAAEPVCLLTYGQTLRSIQNLLADVPFHGFPIIDNKRDRLVTGFIARADIEALIDGVSKMDLARADEVTCHLSRESPPFPVSHWLDWSALVDKHPTCLRPSMPADRIMTIFQSLGLRYALLCSPRGRLMGIIKKKDLLAFLARHNIHHK